MGVLTVVGLGAGDLSQLPLGIYRAIKDTEVFYVRTAEHPVLQELAREGVSFQSFDHIYESYDRFEDVYDAIASALIKEATTKDVFYAVPGHPFVAEKTVQLLQERAEAAGIEMSVLGGASFLDQMYTALGIDPIEGCQIVDGTSLWANELQIRHHLIIVQVYDALIASEVKLSLMEKLPDDYVVAIVTAAGSANEKIQYVQLFELDRYTELNNLTAIYVPPVKEETLLYRDFSFLRDVIARLRGPDGCPWDKKQTHESLKKYLLEETYEVFEAIDEKDDDQLTDELGDVLLQVLLHAQIGEDDGFFSIEDVIEALTTKMIRRHPHVFSDVTVKDELDVIENWKKIKASEETSSDKVQAELSDVTKFSSMLFAAELLQKEAAQFGFEYDKVEDVWDKLYEEIQEFKVEVKKEQTETMEKEFGDVLLAVVSVARFYNLSPEIALHRSLTTFQNRFQFVAKQVNAQGKTIDKCSLEELDQYWEEAKKAENN